jgi:hypothetical protein
MEVASFIVQLLDGVFGVADPGENPRSWLWLEQVMALPLRIR